MLQHLGRLGILGVAGLLAVSCTGIDPPSPLHLLTDAGKALDDAKGRVGQCLPDELAALNKRYVDARGQYYSCDEAGAGKAARGIIDDANALACMAAAPAPAPANRPPIAQIVAPVEGEVNVALAFDASGSSDPDGDALSYTWDFGDGSTARFTFPRTTHRYSRPGNFTVRVTVDDGKGGSDTASARTAVIQRVVLSEEKQVLFDFDKSNLKPVARDILAGVVQVMRDDPGLGAELVGHADSTGTDAYNMGLSQRRAESVRNYLVSQGIAADRFKLDWKGESQPAVPNTTRANRAKNRRVEITIRPMSMQ